MRNLSFRQALRGAAAFLKVLLFLILIFALAIITTVAGSLAIFAYLFTLVFSAVASVLGDGAIRLKFRIEKLLLFIRA